MARPIVAIFGVAPLLELASISAKPDLLNAQLASVSAGLDLDADELLDDGTNSQIIVQRYVRVSYKNYSLVADKLTYKRNSNTLDAIGNVWITEPDGEEVRADRVTLTDDFRDGFLRSFEARTTSARFSVKRFQTR